MAAATTLKVVLVLFQRSYVALNAIKSFAHHMYWMGKRQSHKVATQFTECFTAIRVGKVTAVGERRKYQMDIETQCP